MAETEVKSEAESGEKLAFGAEVSRLLHLMVHAVYSEKEIFLRELVSNASDACDRLRYAALTRSDLTAGDSDLKVVITPNKKDKTLTIADNGIGMNRDDLIENLGTIARSGTGAFVDQMTGDEKTDVSLIGQFGIGFYSAFMVADKVDVVSRKAGEQEAWQWSSDGLGEYTIAPGARDGRGTTIVLHVRKDQKDYLEPSTLRRIVKIHSDHIELPVVLMPDPSAKEEGAEAETVNSASALWTRPKKDITDAQYKEFYNHVGHTFDDPSLTIHYRAEGKFEYSVLMFVPTARPFDLFEPTRKSHMKLYVRRVFITDDCDELIPPYLRFMRGIVDSEDLPLNMSREMLQNNPMITKIRGAVTKRVLTELGKKAKKDPEGYAAFWDVFGPVLKEGIYEDFERRDQLLELTRFRSTTSGDNLVSLADYAERMKEGQSAIYYITGDELEAVRRSPQLEGFAAKEVEVLLLTDPVDDFWISSVPEFDGKAFKSVTRSGDDLAGLSSGEKEDEKDDAEAAGDNNVSALIALLKSTLGDEVKDVRASTRLTDSPVCLVADEGDMDIHMERLLQQHQGHKGSTPRVLEINPKHELIRALSERASESGAADTYADDARLLLDQARIIEGETLPDLAAFSRRMAAAMARGFKT